MMTTENKAIDDLLKPRYKVIADFPANSYYPIGKIIIIEDGGRPVSQNGYAVYLCEFDQ